MADVILARGGTPDFKGWMCEGQFAEFTAPYSARHYDATPPFDSQADAAYGQGYLNLNFPLVPNLNDTTAHGWMQNALKALKTVGDTMYLFWVPTRSFLEALYIEVVNTDSNLDGVYFKPVARRSVWNFTTKEYDLVDITAFDDEIAAAGITQLPLGTPVAGDKLYAIAKMSTNPAVVPSTFGHTIMTYDSTGTPTGPFDAYFGTVMIGLEITAGDEAKIAQLWRSNIAVYITSKLSQFIGASQIG